MRSRYWLLFMALLPFVVWASDPVETGEPNLWDSSYNTNPTATDNISAGDNWFRDVKRELELRLRVEHDFSNIDRSDGDAGITFGDRNRHRPGSARVFRQSAAPTRIAVTDTNPGGVGSSALDVGRVWVDSDAATATSGGTMKCHDGTNFVECIGAFAGQDPNDITLASPADPRLNLITGTNTALQFLKAGLDPMDIHDHDARHLVGGADPIAFLLQAIQTNTGSSETVDQTPTVECAGAPTGEHRLATVTIDFSGRSTTSRVLLVGMVRPTAVPSAGTTTTVDFFFKDNVDGELGSRQSMAIQSGHGHASGVAPIAYHTSVSAASHTWELCGVTGAGNTTVTVTGTAFVLDLGTE